MLRHSDEPSTQARFDDSEWPLFLVTMPNASMSAAEQDENLGRLEEPFTRQQPFAILVDASNAPPMTAVERQAVAVRMRESQARHPGLLQGLALVVPSRLQQGIFTAILWIVRPQYPTASFLEVAQAKVWLREKLKEGKVQRTRVLGKPRS
jgi:hypothetical protein